MSKTTNKFSAFIYGLGLGVALRVARARRQAGKSEPVQDRAHAPLRQPDTEAPLDHGAKVDPAPAHHPVRRRIRPGFDDRGQFAQLFVVQPRPAPRQRPVEKPGQPFAIVAVNPVPQGLAVHAGALRCLGPTFPLKHQCQRQHPARCAHILRPHRLPAQLRCRKLRSRDLNSHDDPPCLARSESRADQNGNHPQSQTLMPLVLGGVASSSQVIKIFTSWP
jgi:hypothetical protein